MERDVIVCMTVETCTHRVSGSIDSPCSRGCGRMVVLAPSSQNLLAHADPVCVFCVAPDLFMDPRFAIAPGALEEVEDVLKGLEEDAQDT